MPLVAPEYIIPVPNQAGYMTHAGSTPPGLSVLVLSPSPELASQVMAQVKALLRYHQGISTASLMEGIPLAQDVHKLRLDEGQGGGVDILVATPGRLLAHMLHTPKFKAYCSLLKVLVVDGVDILLDTCFEQDVDRVLGYLPPPSARQTLMFSRTASDRVVALTKRAMRPQYVRIDTDPEGEMKVGRSQSVPQSLLVFPMEKHLGALAKIISLHQIVQPQDFKIMVFFQTGKVASYMCDLFNQCNSLPGTNTLLLESRPQKPPTRSSKVADTFRQGKRLVVMS